MQPQRQKISVFFPCLNDAKTIAGLISRMFSILQKVAKEYEVIVIDDGSEDQSRQILKRLTKIYPKLKLIFHKRNLGYGAALRSGFKASKYDLVFYTDGDGQYDVKEFPFLLSMMKGDIDFVNGIKLERFDPEYRVILGNLYRFVVRLIFWLPIIDVDCDFRLVRKSLVEKIKLESNSGAICVELIKKVERSGAHFAEVSVHHFPRKFGQSEFFRFDRIFKTYLELVILWFRLMVLDKLL